jgi:hypothetical protein
VKDPESRFSLKFLAVSAFFIKRLTGVTALIKNSIDQHVSDRRSAQRRKSRIPPWVRDYAIELGLVFSILIAIFLLVEPWEIRKTVFGLVRRSIHAFDKATSTIWNIVLQWFGGLTLSDATAIVLLAVVFVVAGLRLRWRIIRSPRLYSNHCPTCNASGLKRIHRRWIERLPTLLGIPVRRYYCGHCGWRGLRIRSRPESSSFPNSPSNIVDRITHQ